MMKPMIFGFRLILIVLISLALSGGCDESVTSPPPSIPSPPSPGDTPEISPQIDQERPDRIPDFVQPQPELQNSAGGQCPLREYACPRLVEYEFSQNIRENYAMVAGGVPVLRFSEAMIKGDELVCSYESEFASPEGGQTIEGFAFYYEAFNPCDSPCPNAVSLTIRDKDTTAPGWTSSTYVRVPKDHPGHVTIVTDLLVKVQEDVPDLPDEYGYRTCGCMYERQLQQEGDFISDPDLYRDMEGFCRVNDAGDGFVCADSQVCIRSPMERSQ